MDFKIYKQSGENSVILFSKQSVWEEKGSESMEKANTLTEGTLVCYR